MTDQEIKQRIRSAVEHAAPDNLELILSFCGEQDPRTRADAGIGSPAAAFCIILDVNPSVYLEVDGEGKVLRAEALGEDAAALVKEHDFTGTDLETAMDGIVKYMLDNGYLSESQNSILISLEDVEAGRQKEVQQKVSGIVEEAMEENMGAGEEGVSVLSQSVDEDDEELAALAGEYGISVGKADLIRKVVAQSAGTDCASDALQFADLAPLSVNEIALLAQKRKLTDGTVTQIGHASEKAYIGQHKALKAALAYAGVRPSRLKKAKVKLDAKKGRMIYKVKLKTKKSKHHKKKDKFKYYLDARTGEMVRIKKQKKHGKHGKHDKYKKYYYGGTIMANENTPNEATANVTASAPQAVQVPAGAIGEQAAKEAALKHAGLSENNALYVYCNPQIGHGPDHYDVKFVANGYKYKYAIGLYDGTVLGRAVKNKAAKGKYIYEGNYHEHYAPWGSGAAPAQAAPTQAAPAQAAPAQAEASAAAPIPAAAQMPSGSMISEPDALAIALKQAGLTQNDLIRWKVKLTTKHGRMLYRFKLKIPGFEHEIDVDAYSGAVTKWHKEIDY